MATGNTTTPPYALLTGCGRSGTTITGRLLSMHPGVAYLFEPRELWNRFIPDGDIWLARPPPGVGRLELGPDDIGPIGAARLRRALRSAAGGVPGALLVEKFPVQLFRLDCVDRVWPGVRIVELVRHGLEVAESIARYQRKRHTWYGRVNYAKWDAYRARALDAGFEREFLDECLDDRSRGLLEWTLCILAGRVARERYGPDRMMTVTYEDLIDDAGDWLERVLRFLGVAPEPGLADTARREVERRTATGESLVMPPVVHPRSQRLLDELGYRYRERPTGVPAGTVGCRVVVDGVGSPAALSDTAAALAGQHDRRFDVVVLAPGPDEAGRAGEIFARDAPGIRARALVGAAARSGSIETDGRAIVVLRPGDRPTRNCVAVLRERLRADPAVAVVGGRLRLADEARRIIADHPFRKGWAYVDRKEIAAGKGDASSGPWMARADVAERWFAGDGGCAVGAPALTVERLPYVLVHRSLAGSASPRRLDSRARARYHGEAMELARTHGRREIARIHAWPMLILAPPLSRRWRTAVRLLLGHRGRAVARALDPRAAIGRRERT